MSAEWPLVVLGEHVDSCLGKMLDKNKNKGVDKPYLGNSNVRWGEFELSDLGRMKFEDGESERYGINDGDLIVCEGGEPGRCAIWKNDLPNMKIQKALHRIRTRESLNNYYLYYWFLYAGKHGLLEPYFTGTTIKHLTGKALNSLKIPLPPRSFQDFIANTLSVFDQKIQANKKINQTLEQMAQALFKSWFVDFEPVKAKIAARQRWQALQPENESASPVCYAAEFDEPPAVGDLETTMNRAAMQAIAGKTAAQLDALHAEDPERYQELYETAALFPSAMQASELGEIPEGWECSTIGAEVEIKGGGTPPTKNKEYWESGSINWTSPKDLSGAQSKVMISTERKITEAGLAKISSGLLPIDTVLMSSRAPVGYLALAKVPVAINQGYIAMICKKRLQPEFVLQWAESVMDDIKQLASGSTFAEISKKSFRGIPVVVPAGNLVSVYSDTTRLKYLAVELNLKSSDRLSDMRDSLLPKLLAGGISLSSQEV
ncbi:restriction endonuclease subunit S [Vreelandella sp. EE27]